MEEENLSKVRSSEIQMYIDSKKSIQSIKENVIKEATEESGTERND